MGGLGSLAFMLLLGPALAAPLIDGRWPELAGRWRDDSGQAFDPAALRGRPAVVTMAFTRCRIVCPMVFERLRELDQEFQAQHVSAEFVVIGFSGTQDDPAAWHRYRLKRGLTGAHWHFLTGDALDTQRFARSFGFSFWNYDEHAMHGYRILTFDAGGAVREEIKSRNENY
jgi:protein SCO1/2